MYIVLNMIYKWKEEEETKKMRNLTDTQVEETKLGIWFEKIINGREYTLYHFDCLARINFLTIDCYFAIFFSLFFFYWKIVVVSDVHTFYFKKKEKFLNSLFKIQIFALKEVWILCSKKKGNLNSRIQNLLCPCYLSMPFCDKKWRCNLSKLNCYNMLIFTYLRLKLLHYKIWQKVFILI